MCSDYIIVGAGITGITAAEELANVLDKKVLLIDKREHIGGNCYDYLDDNGNLIHKYGPHVFHTDNTHVYNFLSLFTRWNNYSHKILFKYNDTLVPVPFNFISVDKALPEDSEEIKIALIEEYEINEKIPIRKLVQSENEHIKQLGNHIYEIFSEHFKKLYQIGDDELSEFVDKMFPFRMSYDCRYYNAMYQVEPLHGYSYMFKNMLSNPNITVVLNRDYNDLIRIDYENKRIFYEDEEFNGHLIFTGMIDEFFKYKYGELEYNSLILENEEINGKTFQDNSVIYYPNQYHLTRVTDYNYLSGNTLDTTVVQFEYPVKYDRNDKEQNIPYYPIDLKRNRKLYEKYKKLSDEFMNVTFVGRLAQYELLQMDECVEIVLDLINTKFSEI